MISRLTDFALKYDLPYRFLAIIPIVLGMSIFISFSVIDTSVTWLAENTGITRAVFALISILCGLRLVWRPVKRPDFVLLYLPIWLYQAAIFGFIIATHRSYTVPLMFIAFDLVVLAIIRWGFKPL